MGFLNFDCQSKFPQEIFQVKKKKGIGLFSEKTENLYAEINERGEPSTNCYSATGDYLQYIYVAFMTKNHQKIRSRCLDHKFSFTYIFLTILILVTEQLF